MTPPTQSPERQRPSIFLVEDEALIAMELRDTLQRMGYDVCGHAARGEAALEEIPGKSPDITLMDINLAGKLSGIDTADALCKRMDLAVIYLSAYADPELVNRAVSTNPFGYLLKPFNRRELFTAIEVALHKHRSEQHLRRARNRCEQRAAALELELRAKDDGICICPTCERVRLPDGEWSGLASLSNAAAEHGIPYSICPNCVPPTSPPSTAV